MGALASLLASIAFAEERVAFPLLRCVTRDYCSAGCQACPSARCKCSFAGRRISWIQKHRLGIHPNRRLIDVRDQAGVRLEKRQLKERHQPAGQHDVADDFDLAQSISRQPGGKSTSLFLTQVPSAAIIPTEYHTGRWRNGRRSGLKIRRW